ncbi:hypothetical protein HO133_008076 [Letharia lupina]|uniref:Ribosomal RNA methyltransferase FtsJ domain-containing protein n=1 Tax=Letharia lupina TaxID=560253 RepID=A0A8H6CSB9_9LECA|nr:uncharacterized protein HO133_008076 [Letharia lupina]KAF6228346.1 hypothetical protein HO133_008076 [Letharia lupina]
MACLSNNTLPQPPPNDGRHDKSKTNMPSMQKYKVAVDRTFPNGRVLGIDIIPAQPPKGVSTIQGNFLSPAIQEEVKRFLRESDRGRIKQEPSFIAEEGEDQMTEEDLEQSSRSYLELEKRADVETSSHAVSAAQKTRGGRSGTGKVDSGMVDVVLSDMSEPWEQTEGFWKRSLSDPYYRMMNTSGVSFRDHAGSMVKAIPTLYTLES